MSDKMKNEIERLEASGRYVADNLVDAIWIFDVESLRYEYVTPSIEKISGYSGDELRTLPLEKWLTPASQGVFQKSLQTEKTKFESTGESRVNELELECIHKGGNTYWAEVRAKYRKDDGKLKILGITKDITERKRLQIKQQELVKKLGDALEEKERLLEENNTLRGLLPICSGCRRIRDDQDRWWPLDAYVSNRAKTKFTHTVCPDCETVIYRDS